MFILNSISNCHLIFHVVSSLQLLFRYEIPLFQEIERGREKIPEMKVDRKEIAKITEKVYEARTSAKAVSSIDAKHKSFLS